MSFALPVKADTPLGWINSGNLSAYTTTKGNWDVSGGFQTVNGTIDFLNLREDLLAANQRLVGKSGDLTGLSFETHYGLTDYFAVFGRYQEHKLIADVGTFSSINVLKIDDGLETTQQEIGFRWMLWESDILNPDDRSTSVAFQLSAYENESDDFDVVIDQITISNVIVTFVDPTTFSVSNMKDDGWISRLLYSSDIANLGVASAWVGYGESSATSGTSTNAINGTIRRLFTQDFLQDEKYLYLGASLNFQITPRIPVSIGYEYIDISESVFSRDPEDPPSQLPGFLSSNGASSDTSNHTLNARLSYWITPEINASLTGNLYSNQFLGRLPHYNNPLSESFSSTPYGFIGLEIGYRF